ncbi:MAG TPA: PglZ domain-containing protein, partial [Ilumatobacteraceae bacterium]|nr:PglZ domain-containing protein [Ilumatobacteraceae bacterium]
MSTNPLPVLPEYSGANVRGIVPALLAPAAATLPAWMPDAARGARQVVLLVVDGLGWEQLQERRVLAPT